VGWQDDHSKELSKELSRELNYAGQQSRKNSGYRKTLISPNQKSRCFCGYEQHTQEVNKIVMQKQMKI
jgi:hypothetical protein